MIPLTNHDFQWGRSEVVIIYPDKYIQDIAPKFRIAPSNKNLDFLELLKKVFLYWTLILI